MRIFKRLICLICILLCVISLELTVYADSKTYYIPELKMSIDIPDYIAVNTRATNPNMTEGIYLEATSAVPDLDIRVHMQQDKKTEEFFNLSLISSSALKEYKNAILENPEYSDCTEGIYGGVLFLDFSTYDSIGDTTVYGRQSVTVVNGMSIVITSTSDGDALKSEEIEIIRNMLASIKFDEILSNSPKISIWAIIIPVAGVIILLAVGFVIFSYFMGKKSREEKKRRRKELERKADYDVLKRAERKPNNPMGLGGYKTSDAFFEDAFNGKVPSRKSAPDEYKPAETAADKAKKRSKRAVKSTGYFFKNLKREMNNSKKTAKKSKKKADVRSRKPQDFDVFSDKL